MMMTLQQATAAIGGEYLGSGGDSARGFERVSTDSRALQPGDLYVALQGEHFDGHQFVAQAQTKGAVAAVVSHRQDADLPQIVVADTRLALGKLAEAWRQQLAIRVVAITGSNGKTTVKEMCAAILRQVGEVYATPGNLNNDIGVPLTLLALRPEHQYAVVEMGANYPGEIGYLTRLAHPDVALINNASRAHLEGFGSLDGVAQTKGEIYNGLTKNGVAIVNNDDHYADYWHGLVQGKQQLSFGLEQPAEVSARWQGDAFGSALQLTTPTGEFQCQLPLPGEHNVRNALAASCVGIALGVPLEKLAAGLAAVTPVKGRMQRRDGAGGLQLIDDTYNANPGSFRVALQVLAACPVPRYLALGDMAELGADARKFHGEAGAAAKQAGIEGLFTLGPLSQAATEQFGEGACHFTDQQQMIAALREQLPARATLLVKGSRSMKMERVVESMCNGSNN